MGLHSLLPPVMQEWLLRLPVRLHGWGFRSLADTCGPAYLGTLETAIPCMTGGNRLCRPMEGAWGGEDCWGEGANPGERWRVLLQSGCQEGLELQGWWGKVQREAREAAQFLGEPLDFLLTSDLKLHRPTKDRHAWAWRQRDKLSSAWLLSLPGGGEFLSNEEFSNSAAINLCVPPPCVAGREGETIRGRAVVDRQS